MKTRDILRSMPERAFDDLFDQPSEHEALRQFFGAQNFDDIMRYRDRAQAERARRDRDEAGETVLIVPGFLGSELSVLRGGSAKKIWLNFRRILVNGRLFDIAPGQEAGLVLASGVLRDYYFKIKIGLEAAGFRCQFHPFDWRMSIEHAGALLAQKIQTLGSVSLVCHSMGGLVARAAAAPGSPAHERIRRVIQLGTPNAGSYSAVLALRGNHDLLRKLERYDLHHSMQEYGQTMFRPMTGLYHLLPAGFEGVTDLFMSENWPRADIMPDPDLLRNAKAVRERLYKGDRRFRLIAGVNQPTFVSNEHVGSQFRYGQSVSGDGTVAVTSALMPDFGGTYFVEDEHGVLANNTDVIDAAADLLRSDDTAILPKQWEPATETAVLHVTDAELMTRTSGPPDRAPTDEDEADLLNGILDIESTARRTSSRRGAGAAGAAARSDEKPRRRRLTVRVTCGELLNVPAPMIALGHFEGERTTAAMRTFDAVLDGQLSKLLATQKADGTLGKTKQFWCRRFGLFADHILLVGLGPFDRFGKGSIELAAHTMIAEAAAQRIQEIGTVALGIGTGFEREDSVKALLNGFTRALATEDPDGVVHTVHICDYRISNCLKVAETVRSLLENGKLNGIELFVEEDYVPGRPLLQSRDAPQEEDINDPIYLYLRGNPDRETNTYYLESSIWTVGGQAAVPSRTAQVPLSMIEDLVRELDNRREIRDQFLDFGNRLSTLLLGEVGQELIDVLGDKDKPLIIRHGKYASSVPWETLYIGDRAPARENPVSRQYLSMYHPVMKKSALALQDELLKILLIVNPTDDLPGAENEGEMIKTRFGNNPDIDLTVFTRGEATFEAVSNAFNSGAYDVAHYAGHGFFDPADPSASGLILADKPFTGLDAQRLQAIPNILIFNACETGLIRRGPGGSQDAPSKSVVYNIERSVGLAEAFLLAGAGHYVSTYWPVGDAAAADFAAGFYDCLMHGNTIGTAIKHGRLQALQTSETDWADYIHYGDPNQKLKLA